MRAFALVLLFLFACAIAVSPNSSIYEPIVLEIASRTPDRVIALTEVRLVNQPANVRTVSARVVARGIPRGMFGVIQLSPPVMRGADRAEVEVSFACGPVCGDGTRVVLEKRGAAWVIVEKVPLWVS